ncbi:MAG: hypothetical protein AAFQ57_16405, partial [Cyanobacteria bacterium J06626_14]
VLKRASDSGVRIGLERHGQPIAGIVPFADVATLEEIDARAVEIADAQEAGAEQVQMVLQGDVDRYVAYVTGQIDARLADSGLIEDQSLLTEIQGIVAHSIQASLDPETAPNAPRDLVHSAAAADVEEFIEPQMVASAG